MARLKISAEDLTETATRDCHGHGGFLELWERPINTGSILGSQIVGFSDSVSKIRLKVENLNPPTVFVTNIAMRRGACMIDNELSI
jgi:hypothetical protein